MKWKFDGPSVEEAQTTIKELQATLAAMKWPSTEYNQVFFVALPRAQAALRAALRAEKTPRTICAECGKRLKPGKPVVAGRGRKYGFGSLLCLPCDRKQRREVWDQGSYALPDRQQPCPTCGRPMYFRDYVDRPVPCSYQCAYRDTIAKQLERRKVEPQPKTCASCGREFTPKRADAIACGNACRQRLFRLSQEKGFGKGQG
jgi:hypothetical protein